MSALPGGSPELDELLGAIREGSVTPDQARRLEELLAAGPAAERYYLEYIELCATLHYYHGASVPGVQAVSDCAPARAVLDDSCSHTRCGRKSFWAWWPTIPFARRRLLPAAAIVVAMFAIGLAVRSRTDRIPQVDLAREAGGRDARRPHHDRRGELAIVLKLDAVRWQGANGSCPAEGTTVAAGPLQLRSGRATLAFLSGVLLTIEGPAMVELDSMERVYCRYGKVRVRVPAGADGFVVTAPGSAFVDQGTEFALNVKEDGRARVKVIEGATEAALLGSTGNPDHCWLVTQNEVFELDPATGRIIEAPPDSDSFASIPEFDVPPLVLQPSYPAVIGASRPTGYWRFESTAGTAIPNEIAGGPPLRTSGAVDLSDTAQGTRFAQFRPGHDDQFLVLDGLWSPASQPGHAIEFWVLSGTIGYASLVALYRPTDSGRFKHLLLMELTGGGRKALLHKPVSARFLHRWPPDEVGGQNVYSANHYIPNRWYHVVVQKNSERMELFLDGVLSDSTTLDSAHATAPCRLVIGRLGPVSTRPGAESRAFVGRIDEFAIYDRPLSAAEVRRHFELADTGQNDRIGP